jgi:hypothetical protein
MIVTRSTSTIIKFNIGAVCNVAAPGDKLEIAVAG